MKWLFVTFIGLAKKRGKTMLGNIHSIETFGSADGPGVRYLNILIVVGDFGGGVKFFEKIFVEIFVFHI